MNALAMTISSFDALYLTLTFLVPGFIVQSMIAVSVPQRSEASHLSFLRFLTLSCINYGLWSWLVYLIHTAAFFVDHPLWSAVGWFVVILIGPALLGLLIGHLHAKDHVRRFLQRLGLAPLHVIPTAWDYKFSRTRDERYVIVTLKDGRQVYGLFAAGSFSSDAPGERDLFLERTYRNVEDRWEPVPGQDGILITRDEIRYIEFITS